MDHQVLVARLQEVVKTIVDKDQTGFVKTRHMADNFLNAKDLVKTCRKRKRNAMTLKLDFSKAFDTISWDAFFAIIEAIGFNSTWIGRVKSLLSTAKTMVLQDGQPGGVGLNQEMIASRGPPLATPLRISGRCSLWAFRHPVMSDKPCPFEIWRRHANRDRGGCRTSTNSQRNA